MSNENNSPEWTEERTRKVFDSQLENVLDTRSPEEIEAERVLKAEQAALKAASEMKAEDLCAHFFQALYPNYQSRLHALSKKELIRLADALVHWPLETVMPTSEAGKDCVAMGLRLIDAKLVMRETVHLMEKEEMDLDNNKEVCDNAEEAEALANSAVTSFEQGEEVNG